MAYRKFHTPKTLAGLAGGPVSISNTTETKKGNSLPQEVSQIERGVPAKAAKVGPSHAPQNQNGSGTPATVATPALATAPTQKNPNKIQKIQLSLTALAQGGSLLDRTGS